MAHMRAQMLAMRVEHARVPILAAPRDEIAPEIAKRLHLALAELVGEKGCEPAIGKGDVEIALGHAGAARYICHPPARAVLRRHVLEGGRNRDRRRIGRGNWFLRHGSSARQFDEPSGCEFAGKGKGGQRTLNLLYPDYVL